MLASLLGQVQQHGLHPAVDVHLRGEAELGEQGVDVFFDGKDMAKLTDRELTHERTRFGFVFQGAALFDSLSIFAAKGCGTRAGRSPLPEDVRALRQQGTRAAGTPYPSTAAVTSNSFGRLVVGSLPGEGLIAKG